MYVAYIFYSWISKEKYNEVNMYFMTWTEALFIIKELIHDYNEGVFF